MKHINQAIGLTGADFDFGEISGVFNLTPSGWNKIYKYYGVKTANKTPTELYQALKPHLKKITGSRIYKYSGAQPLTASWVKDNPFANSGLLTTLEVLGVVKEELDSVYTDSGVYFENTIRNSLNGQYGVKKWYTFGFQPETNEHLTAKFAGETLVARNDPVFSQSNGSIFNLGELALSANNMIYHIDFSIFGGMPDGYPVWNDGAKRAFNLVECKTKSFYKLENSVKYDDFGDKVYEPVVEDAVRTYEIVYDKDGSATQANFLSQRKKGEPRVLDNFKPQKLSDGKTVRLIELNGYFPKIKMTEGGVPQLFPEKQQKQFKKDGSFYVNDEGYYAQAALYALLTYLAFGKIDKTATIPVDNVLQKLKVMFAVGLLAPENYIKETIDGKANVFTVYDGNAVKPLSDDLNRLIFKLADVKTELFKASDLKLYNPKSIFADQHREHAGEIGILGLLADCNEKYASFFRDKKGLRLEDAADHRMVESLRRYFMKQKEKRTL